MLCLRGIYTYVADGMRRTSYVYLYGVSIEDSSKAIELNPEGYTYP